MSEHQDWAVADNPLAAAVQQRDADILQVVRDALEARNVMLAFQPIVQSSNPARPAFFEGLIRVMDETRRVIPAREFIGTIEPLAEGRVIDCLALEMGCQALIENPGLRLSINISPRTIGYPRWEQVFEAAIGADPTLGERLILEITEASAMVMPDVVVDFMDRVHNLGVSFALDDFGAGYTAFRYFNEFFFDMVKIDCSFIRDIHTSRDNQILTEALVSIAQHFDMFTVAEGIEATQEAEYLIGAGVDCLQGYLFGAPQLRLPPSAMGNMPKVG